MNAFPIYPLDGDSVIHKPRTFADQMVDILDDSHRQIAAAFAIPLSNIAPSGRSGAVMFGREPVIVLPPRIWQAMTDGERLQIRRALGEPRA